MHNKGISGTKYGGYAPPTRYTPRPYGSYAPPPKYGYAESYVQPGYNVFNGGYYRESYAPPTKYGGYRGHYGVNTYGAPSTKYGGHDYGYGSKKYGAKTTKYGGGGYKGHYGSDKYGAKTTKYGKYKGSYGGDKYGAKTTRRPYKYGYDYGGAPSTAKATAPPPPPAKPVSKGEDYVSWEGPTNMKGSTMICRNNTTSNALVLNEFDVKFSIFNRTNI